MAKRQIYACWDVSNDATVRRWKRWDSEGKWYIVRWGSVLQYRSVWRGLRRVGQYYRFFTITPWHPGGSE